MVCSDSPSNTFSKRDSLVISYSLKVNVHTVDIVQEDASAFGGGQTPISDLGIRILGDPTLSPSPEGIFAGSIVLD